MTAFDAWVERPFECIPFEKDRCCGVGSGFDDGTTSRPTTTVPSGATLPHVLSTYIATIGIPNGLTTQVVFKGFLRLFLPCISKLPDYFVRVFISGSVTTSIDFTLSTSNRNRTPISSQPKTTNEPGRTHHSGFVNTVSVLTERS